MSDTPRTDKESFFPHDSQYQVCDAVFARQLERELNAANERIRRLEKVIQERDKEWFQVIESILGFHPVSMTEALRIGIERIKKQSQRIKRLDEALSCVVPKCLELHHSKKHRHSYNEPCPVEELITKAKEAKL